MPHGADPKHALRKKFKAARLAIPLTDADQAAMNLIAHCLAYLNPLVPCTVAAYLPVHGEISPLKLMEKLAATGCTTALPVTPKIGDRLLFRSWKTGEPLQTGAYGIGVPLSQAAEVIPEIMLVPLLAFDKRGHRLGYGGGFYDATIKQYRNANPAFHAIGLAFTSQQTDNLPIHDGDQVLDAVITEQGVAFTQ